MRLTILLYSLGSGGAERITSVLLHALHQKYKITLVLLEDIRHYPLPNGITPVILGQNHTQESGLKKLLKLPFLAFKYHKLIKNSDISLSLMTRPNYINILAGMLCKLQKKHPRILISERSHPSLQYGYKNLNSKINRFLIRTLYKKADKISANSPNNLHDLVQNFNLAESKTTLLLNCFDLDKIHTQSKEQTPLKEKLLNAKSKGKFIFISIGRLDKGKNHRLLIHAMRKFHHHAELFIIGDGDLKETLHNEIYTLNLKHCVHLLGKSTNPYAPLSVADCFLFGSNHEGFPNVLVEALALKIPVISTNCAPSVILSPFKTLENTQCKLAKGGIITPLNALESMEFAMQFILQNPKYFDKETLFNQAKLFSLETQLPLYEKWIFNP